MIKYLIPVLLAISSNIAQSQPTNCGETKEVLSQLIKNYKEKPIWVGKSDTGGNVAVLANSENKSWTMLYFDDKIACLVLIGNDSKLIEDSKTKINASSQIH